MSDADLLRSMEVMEAWLNHPESMPDAETLAGWNRQFQTAVEQAERGPGWAELVSRAHALGERVQRCTGQLAAQRDAVKRELDSQGRGERALKGYGAGLR
jgi:flagellar hook-associated protein FlgK